VEGGLTAMACHLARYFTLEVFGLLHSLSETLVHSQRFLLFLSIVPQLTLADFFYDFLLTGVQQEIVDA
jgi:hypothetical protein